LQSINRRLIKSELPKASFSNTKTKERKKERKKEKRKKEKRKKKAESAAFLI
jgi:hypothetical protein